MTTHTRLHVLTSMIQTGLVPVFYTADVDVACRIAEACAAGGARCIEFTNRGDRAHQVFAELAERCRSREDLILGAGSVLDPYTAALYIQLGAAFIVGPSLNPEVARLCNRRKVAYCPGCGSVSEISQAEELGVEICKVFPGGEVGGPAFVQAIRGPMPWTRIMPTGGVDPTRESIKEWLGAGAACLGIGSKLITAEYVRQGNYEAITHRVRQVCEWIRELRGDSPLL